MEQRLQIRKYNHNKRQYYIIVDADIEQLMIKHEIFIEDFDSDAPVIIFNYFITIYSNISGYNDEQWKEFLNQISAQRLVIMYLESKGYELEISMIEGDPMAEIILDIELLNIIG